MLFVCIHNAGRSQMAEAFLNKVSGGKHQGISAGSMSSDKINFVAVESMTELCINIRSARTRRLNTEMMQGADLVVTMGCGEDVCPVIPVEMENWSLDNPHGQPMEVVRGIRDEIQSKVNTLVSTLDMRAK
ncbi:MAG: phosphotyrosine protein phosphatase [Candidatus Bathyarchaeota archaeon]|nr:phosphotyrosine protein phosphatase [Candidatus Bathyarchaeota archaeon]